LRDRHEAKTDVRLVLRVLLLGARADAPLEDGKYLDTGRAVIESGSRSERIRARLARFSEKPDSELNDVARRIYVALCDCLDANEPWDGRWG
jgi:hypothetical protein